MVRLVFLLILFAVLSTGTTKAAAAVSLPELLPTATPHTVAAQKFMHSLPGKIMAKKIAQYQKRLYKKAAPDRVEVTGILMLIPPLMVIYGILALIFSWKFALLSLLLGLGLTLLVIVISILTFKSYLSLRTTL